MVTRKTIKHPCPGFATNLPPPLCFTVPAGSYRATGIPAGARQPSGQPGLAAKKPHLMADPSDSSTWQRPYRFTL